METKLQVIKTLASSVIDTINAGTCEMSEAEVEEMFEQIEKMVKPDRMYSLYESSRFLGVSERTMRNYVKSGKLRAPRSKQGWTEKYYLREDLLACKENLKNGYNNR